MWGELLEELAQASRRTSMPLTTLPLGTDIP
jgi:hypothetical protein